MPTGEGYEDLKKVREQLASALSAIDAVLEAAPVMEEGSEDEDEMDGGVAEEEGEGEEEYAPSSGSAARKAALIIALKRKAP